MRPMRLLLVVGLLSFAWALPENRVGPEKSGRLPEKWRGTL